MDYLTITAKTAYSEYIEAVRQNTHPAFVSDLGNTGIDTNLKILCPNQKDNTGMIKKSTHMCACMHTHILCHSNSSSFSL